MVLRKKKNIVFISVIAAVLFFVYQLYFLFTFMSENSTGVVYFKGEDKPHFKEKANDVKYIRSEADKYISKHGILRGVLKQNILKYRPNSRNEFKCLNSEQTIPFDRLNDDYCDCEDGTDEPSTSACPNGVFYCEKQRPKFIALSRVPSSRVNDGICDCCDGSDEWDMKNSLLQPGPLTNDLPIRPAKCPYVC